MSPRATPPPTPPSVSGGLPRGSSNGPGRRAIAGITAGDSSPQSGSARAYPATCSDFPFRTLVCARTLTMQAPPDDAWRPVDRTKARIACLSGIAVGESAATDISLSDYFPIISRAEGQDGLRTFAHQELSVATSHRQRHHATGHDPKTERIPTRGGDGSSPAPPPPPAAPASGFAPTVMSLKRRTGALLGVRNSPSPPAAPAAGFAPTVIAINVRAGAPLGAQRASCNAGERVPQSVLTLGSISLLPVIFPAVFVYVRCGRNQRDGTKGHRNPHRGFRCTRTIADPISS